MEYQFHGEPIDFVPFPGVRVIYAPNDDDPITPPHREHLAVALRAAREVSDGLRHGLKTLVTCWAGLNRSGLVTALSLHLLTGCSGFDAVRLVKRHRRHALSNPQFVDVLCRLKAVPQPGAEVELTL